MKTEEFLKFISTVTSLDHDQRTLLTQELGQLADESYRHGIVDGLQRYRCKACKKPKTL